jgi:membrane protease YdiL (CAAX protease family)
MLRDRLPDTSWFQNRPFLTAMLALAFYFLVFAALYATKEDSFGRGSAIGDIDSMNSAAMLEVFLVLSIIALITWLRWWRKILFVRPDQGGWLWAAVPAAVTTLVLFVALNQSGSEGAAGAAFGGGDKVRLVVAVTLMVGIFEELLFRGVVYFGLKNVMTPVAAVFASAALFGLMHYVNFIQGQPLGITTRQVLHAAGSGVLYGALVLRMGSLLPGIFLHGYWDLSVSLNTTASAVLENGADAAAGTGTAIVAILFGNFELILGLIILWIWYRHRKISAGKTT